MRVGLLTTLDHNIGDDFIRHGLLHVITSLCGMESISTVAVNKHHPYTVYPWWHPRRLVHAQAADRIPWAILRRLRARALRLPPGAHASRFDSCDIVVQCGTPVLWEDCRYSEWAKPVWEDVLARISPRVPVLNLGGGSCYPCERIPSTLVGAPDEKYARLMLNASALTVVRDELAENLFASIGGKVSIACCPAFLAGQAYVDPVAQPRRKVLVNYMRGAAHDHWNQNIDADDWERTLVTLVQQLARESWEVLLICHNQKEFDLADKILPGTPRVLPRSVPEYFALARDAAFGVFNRLHAGVALGGLGIPSVCVGTDTRQLMVQQIGLPTLYVKEAKLDRLLNLVERTIETRSVESQRLLKLRAETLRQYQEILRPWWGNKRRT